jgi:hypothetical protein
MDSPFAVTSAEFALTGIIRSRDAGRASSFFQGPGESPDISGEGSGVTSAIAFNIGEDNAEFGAEPRLPTLLPNMCLILGVRVIGFIGMLADFDFDGVRLNSLEPCAVLFALAAVTVKLGFTSVCIRRPALRGLEFWLGLSVGRRREVVFRGLRFELFADETVFGGGDGAIVFD